MAEELTLPAEPTPAPAGQPRRASLLFVAVLALVVGLAVVGATFLSLQPILNGLSDGMAELVAQNAHLSDRVQRLEQRSARDELLANPEILEEVQRAFLAKKQRELEEGDAQRVAANRAVLVSDPVNGQTAEDSEALVTVVEFLDYNCGYCRKSAAEVTRLASEVKGVRVLLRDLPFLGEGSAYAARVALLLRKHDPLSHFPEAMLAATEQLTVAKVDAMLTTAGISPAAMKAEMEAEKEWLDKVLSANRDLAGQLLITGTPAFVVGDRVVRSGLAFEQLAALVERARASHRATAIEAPASVAVPASSGQ